jgi:phenylacetate-CoA ligase
VGHRRSYRRGRDVVSRPGAPERSRWALWLLLHTPGQIRIPFRSPATIARHQRRRLAETVDYAYRHVPHYREAMTRRGLRPGDISTAADLARLPLLERAEIQRDPERFTSREHPIERHVPLQTGGSSGVPLTIYYDPFALAQLGAHSQRAGSFQRRLARRRLRCRTLAIAHRPVASTEPVQKTFGRLRKLAGLEFRLASILDPVERNLEQINRYRPHILLSHGSYLEALFVHLHARDVPMWMPRLVLYGGDAMSRSARALIEHRFGVPVLSVYGAYEAPSMAFECPHRLGLHVNVDLYPLRIVDDSGREVRDGAKGDVVISNLVNRGTILLNYRLGDLARWTGAECPCGRTLPLLSFAGERKGDWLLTASGQKLHPATVTEVLEVDRDIFRYQVTQRAVTRLSIGLVCRPDSDRAAIRERVKHGFAELLGPELEVEVEFVDDLPRTARGKVRTVVGLDSAS